MDNKAMDKSKDVRRKDSLRPAHYDGLENIGYLPPVPEII